MYAEYEALRKHGDLYMELAFTQGRASRSHEQLKPILSKLVDDQVVKDAALTYTSDGTLALDPTEQSELALRMSMGLSGSEDNKARGLYRQARQMEKEMKRKRQEANRMVLVSYARSSSKPGSPIGNYR